MGKMERPPEVKDALYRADHDALSRMGRKGALAAEETKRLKKAEKEARLQEAAAAQAEVLSLSPDGDVLPPDEKIIASYKDQ